MAPERPGGKAGLPGRSGGARTQPGPGAPALAGIAGRQRLVRRARLAVPLLLVVAALAGAVIVALEEPPSPPPAAPALPPDPMAALTPAARDSLLAPTLEKPARFRRVYGGHPRALCEAITGLGIPMSDWRPDPFVAGSWYCASELVTIGRTGADGSRSTLFVNLRGPGETELGTVRIKLNGENPQSVPAARASLLRILDAVGRRYGWPWPPSLRAAIERNTAAEAVQYGMVSRVLPEDAGLTGDGTNTVRLNVIVDFPTGDFVAPAEMFAPFPWDPEEPPHRRNIPTGGATLNPVRPPEAE